MTFETLLFEKKIGYAIITLNRPDKLNALNNQLFSDLSQAVSLIADDTEIHAAIITGTGSKAFAAGADIAELHEQDDLSGVEFSKIGQRVFDAIEHLGKPVIAAVNGFALGGGCELALSCHIRFAAANAKFGQPEVNLGILPGYGGTQRLSRIVGSAKSAELILSGMIITAENAEKIGLVNSVHELSYLMEFAEKFVQTIVSKAPLAVYAALQSIVASKELSPEEGMNFESRKFGEICGTDDFKEGTKAFLEKRTAVFSGK
ncbi:MAG: enoyl-CoA hydratase/isomerase family protein [Ignavibacteriae bacterium]|nr:enoyl-CoA hydratase/isomerase family protein [Ignavibacteriota bacterium]